MAINTIKATMQMRRGNEPDFDPDQMTAGEWAVSLDSKKVWMCFAPGLVRRMATYEAFEEDMKEIQLILATCQDIQAAVEAFEQLAERHKDASEEYSKLSKSYAVGTGGEVREGDNSDCAQYYYEQTKRISQGINGIIPMGTIAFSELSLPKNEVPRYMFDISDDFVSDERFKNGSGIHYGAGSNVLRTADGMWDVTAASAVSGVKGAAETKYRQGFVDISCEDVGALPVDGDAKDAIVTFTSGDSINPTGWSEIEVVSTGEKLGSLMQKFSLFAKNVRYLWKFMGNTSLSGIGDGTVTGAVSSLSTGMKNIGNGIYSSTLAQTITPQVDIEMGSITLPSGFWIIHFTAWLGVFTRKLTINGFEILNDDHKPELIAFYNGSGAELPLTIYSWDQSDVEIGPGLISAYRLK